MSAGLPIIASRIGGLPELVEDGENGFLFNPALELCDAILTFAADDELRLRMGTKGRERAVANHDLARNVHLGGPAVADVESLMNKVRQRPRRRRM